MKANRPEPFFFLCGKIVAVTVIIAHIAIIDRIAHNVDPFSP
jgi:hypothetical protein